jgi:WD40 repeat protein/serine/threonine protein kinase
MTVAMHVQPRSAGRTDSIQAELVEQYLERLQAGETLDPSEFAAQYPEHAEALRQLLPALRMMAELSGSAVRERASMPLSEAISGPELGLLGDFRILREVGRGGMGVVYEAEQLSLHRRVAFKVLPLAGALDPRQLQRFKTEAQAAALLHHTNIVPIHAVGCERGVHYYAMQFIEGKTLAEVIRQLRQVEGLDETPQAEAHESMPTSPPFKGGARGGSLGGRTRRDSEAPRGTQGATDHQDRERPGGSQGANSTRNRAYFRHVADLGIQAAEALDNAHAHGVIHRDIKPANLLLDASGRLWITDFGLARLQDDNGLTMTGDLLGTLRYMSPEQALAKRGYLDDRTDIYSLGATLYELLTLHPAIEGQDRQEILRKIAQEEPAPPRKFNPAIPRELETILLKTMNKEPGDRYATAQELAADLRRFLENRPIKARRPSLWDRTLKFGRRHAGIVAAAFVLLLLAAGGLAASLILIGRERDIAATKAREATASAKQARQRAIDLERQLYINRVNRALGEWRENNVALAESLLEQCAPAWRGWEWHYCRGLCHLEEWSFHGHVSPIHSVAFGPEGRWIITATLGVPGPGEWGIWDALTSREVARRQVSGDCRIAVDRSGTMLAVGSNAAPRCAATVALWQMTPDGTLRISGEPDRIVKLEHNVILDLAFDPEGRRIAVATGAFGNRAVELWDVRAGKRAHNIQFHGRGAFAVAFRPDGNQLAVACLDGEASLHDVTSGKPVGCLRGHAGSVHDVAYSPNGEFVATGGLDETVRVWETRNGQIHAILSGHGSAVRAITFNHDGSRIASASQDNTVRLWDPATGKAVGILRGHGQQVRALAYSPDGQRLVGGSEDGMVKLWNARVGEPEQTLRHTKWVPRAAFFPNGSMIAAADWDNEIRIWDLATGREIRVLRGGVEAALTRAGRQPEIMHSLAISSDGLRIASTNRSGTVQVWDAATGRLVCTLRGHDDRTLGVMFHPDGRRIASAGWDGTVRVWDADAGKQVRVLQGPGAKAITAAYSSDGSRIASAFADGTVLIWDASSGQEVLRLASEVPAGDGGTTSLTNMLAFRFDGRWMAVCSNAGDLSPGEVWVFDLTTCERILTLRGHTSRVVAVAFSPDGLRIASASFDRTVKLWELETGQEVCTLRGHTAGVLSVMFSSDGASLVTSSMDCTAKVWSASATPKHRETQARDSLSHDTPPTGENEVNVNKQGTP